jgi:hypothetical protein
MTHLKLVGAALRAAVVFGIVSGSMSAAIAQTSGSMGGMQMAPGSKMDMKKMPAKKAAHHNHATQHKHAKHHKSAAK